MLRNGDRITGQLVRLENGKLTLRTSYAGNVKIDRKEIATLSTDRALLFALGYCW
ncbi:MAG: hypothetical protein ACREUQ_14820 [Burkholderiales bacterium]